MAQELARKRKRVSEVILIWPSTDLPYYIRDMLMRLKDTYGARVVAVKVRPSDVDRLMGYLDAPEEEVPEVHRSFVRLLQRFDIRDLPALVVDGRLAAQGSESEVLRALQLLL